MFTVFLNLQQIAVIFRTIIIVRFSRASISPSKPLLKKSAGSGNDEASRLYIGGKRCSCVCTNICERHKSGFKSPFGSFNHFSSLFLSAMHFTLLSLQFDVVCAREVIHIPGVQIFKIIWHLTVKGEESIVSILIGSKIGTPTLNITMY